jgi:uncharacterized lipoprotein YddW (UPF0748 family)
VCLRFLKCDKNQILISKSSANFGLPAIFLFGSKAKIDIISHSLFHGGLYFARHLMIGSLKHVSVWLLVTTLLAGISLKAAEPEIAPPEPEREFRGAWVASVSNIDWPSAKGLPVAQQKRELIAILDRAVQLKLNAVILQVRPACDALYDSKFEPWSEYLTGTMGKAPSPYYDPLEFAVTEAHKRGLELHAWFNPYRARVLGSRSPVSNDHISKTHPELVREYVKYLWLDPGEPGVQQHSLNVIMDVVKRYDVDGIHFDDYFYPYQDRDKSGKILDFPDEPSWQRYKKAGGTLARNDWRRENVNMFIERLYKEIKAEKPWVKFGISPFGIWKPGNPPTIQGLNSYESLYADSRKWLAEGWLDYFAPQLYWNIDQKAQSYPVLLKWWVEQNSKNRHMWPGISTARVGNTRPPEEIVNQISLTRKQPGATGNIHWSVKSLMHNQRGVATLLAKNTYTVPALIPASPWLSKDAPSKPDAWVKNKDEKSKLHWRAPTQQDVWLWVVQKRIDGKWTTEIVSGDKRSLDISGNAKAVDFVSVRSSDRYGNLSEPVVVSLKKEVATK